MHGNHLPTPLCGPIPDGLMRITVDIPMVVFDDLEHSSRRRGVPLDQLVVAALLFAASTP